jgi:hypothetical protein
MVKDSGLELPLFCAIAQFNVAEISSKCVKGRLFLDEFGIGEGHRFPGGSMSLSGRGALTGGLIWAVGCKSCFPHAENPKHGGRAIHATFPIRQFFL